MTTPNREETEYLETVEKLLVATLDNYFEKQGRNLSQIKIRREACIVYQYVSKLGNAVIIRLRRERAETGYLGLLLWLEAEFTIGTSPKRLLGENVLAVCSHLYGQPYPVRVAVPSTDDGKQYLILQFSSQANAFHELFLIEQLIPTAEADAEELRQYLGLKRLKKK
jgi:hypothetical protein